MKIILKNKYRSINIDLDDKMVLSPDEYNDTVIGLRQFDPISCIEVGFNKPISAFIYDNGFIIMDEDGNDMSYLLPNDDRFLIQFPDIRLKKFTKNRVYDFKSFTFNSNMDFKYDEMNIRIPEYKTSVDKKCHIDDDSIICDEYTITSFMTCSSIDHKTKKYKLTKKDSDLFRKLNPIIIELNQIQNRLMPDKVEILPTVDLEFNDRCHLSGKLIRNNKCINRNEITYLKDAKKVVDHIRKNGLPLIADHNKLGQFNTKVKGLSIIPKGKIFTNVEDYIDSINMNIYDLEHT